MQTLEKDRSPVHTKHYLIIIILGSLAALAPFAVDMYLPSLNTIAQYMQSDISVVQQTISIFLLVFGLGQLIYGPITDYFGRRPVIICGLLAFIISSLLAASSTTIEFLMLSRVLQALSGGAIGVCVTASIRDHFAGNHLAKANSYLMMVVIIAPMIAPLIGGQILLYLSWQWIFITLSVVATINLITYSFSIKESLTTHNRQPLNINTIFKNYWLILQDRKSLSYIFISAFSSAPMFIFITSSSFVYIEYFNVSEQHFGFLFGANIILMMLMSFTNTRLLNHFSWRNVLHTAIFIRLIPAIGLLFIGLYAEEYLLFLLVMMVILNVGLTPLVGANAQAGFMSMHGKNAGSAAALMGSFRFIIGGVSSFVLSAFHTNNHMTMVWGMLITTVIMLLSYLFLLRTEAHTSSK